jgi:hypothetical protein
MSSLQLAFAVAELSLFFASSVYAMRLPLMTFDFGHPLLYLLKHFREKTLAQ